MFVGLLMLFFKFYRFIFILIALEFLIISLFVKFFSTIGNIIFFYFMCFSVISRILGMVIIVGNIKYYGNDKCVFCRFKLNCKLLIFKIKNFIYKCLKR